MVPASVRCQTRLKWGDAGSDTFGHVLASRIVHLPNLRRYGLGNIRSLQGVSFRLQSQRAPMAVALCVRTAKTPPPAIGKWRASFWSKHFPTYPNGFPSSVIDHFIRETGVPGILGNIPASGTEIIKDLGAEHVRAASPLSTSADSVFQIAAHEQVIPLPKLYGICETARRLLAGEHEVGRVIARPFLGEPGAFYRTENRHDYAVPPPRENLLVALAEEDFDVVCIGKIASIYDSNSVTQDLTAKNNEQSIEQTIRRCNKHRAD